jgi:hypothetical protein
LAAGRRLGRDGDNDRQYDNAGGADGKPGE